jgi:PadR family transcriptional regulator PadR
MATQSENTKAQMRKGVLEYCILRIIGNHEVYASDIIDHMRNAQLLVVEGTLYPLLTRLKNDGYLQYQWIESVQGPPRKYYKLTQSGENYLNALHEGWLQLVESVATIHQIKNS